MNSALILSLLAATATPISEPTPSELLERGLPVLELMEDKHLIGIFDTYAECYLRSVDANPASDLKKDTATNALFKDAFDTCSSSRKHVDTVADEYLTGIQPNRTLGERKDLLTRVRRTYVLVRVMNFFSQKGLGKQYEAYLGRTIRKTESHRVNSNAPNQ